ncbi:cell wall-binding repeat-containing protein [Fictibacillus halophilus]|uniref:cell wall-binding repeat-containing protein n=1 Tax=Fictibacillus halophilus TaxID=1610490 RepID=UPI001CF9A6F3|nr:cell wall-binding repeat-containing protein [Fictibacillus halophilus]
MKKLISTVLLAFILLIGFSTIDVYADGTTVMMDPDDVKVEMKETGFASWTSDKVHGVWDIGETVDRFEFITGPEGLYGHIGIKLERSWHNTLENVRLENTLYAQLKNGQYIKVLFDSGDDEYTTVNNATSLQFNEEIKKNGGVENLTGKFIYETIRLDNKDKEFTYDLTFTFEERNNFIRFGGKDRYEVERNLNNKIAEKSLDTVMITSGLKYSDALVGSVLNKKKNGTILLISENDAVIQSKIAEAKRLLKPTGKIYILGGTGTVSSKIENELKKHFPVERIAGKDRLEVALKIAEITTTAPTELFLVYGLVFSDSLSVAPVATERQTPILPQWGKTLKPEIKDYIKKHPTIKKVYIVSGTGVIPVSIEEELKNLGVTSVERIADKDRYLTSLAIAKKFYPTTKSVAIANGLVFADALSGARYAWSYKSPIVLVEKDMLPYKTTLYMTNLKRIWLFGGPATLEPILIEIIN